jgi:hypothetical protein
MKLLKEYIKNTIKEYLSEAYLSQSGSLEDLSQEDMNEILKGYIECALWTEEERLTDDATFDIDDEDYEEMSEVDKIINLKGKFDRKTFSSFVSDDIDIDSKIDAYGDIKKFIMTAGDEAIEEAIEENGLFQLGMDIWFTRNGHGSGFFDRNYENEDALMEAGRKLKSKDLYVGDDGKLYFM